MQCAPTKTPEDIDISALREKYLREREKRLRPEGQKQYVRPTADVTETFDADPHMPLVPRAPISEDIDVVVLGAGWGGVMAAYHLKQAGIHNFRNVDIAGTSAACGTGTAIPAFSATTNRTAIYRF